MFEPKYKNIFFNWKKGTILLYFIGCSINNHKKRINRAIWFKRKNTLWPVESSFINCHPRVQNGTSGLCNFSTRLQISRVTIWNIELYTHTVVGSRRGLSYVYFFWHNCIFPLPVEYIPTRSKKYYMALPFDLHFPLKTILLRLAVRSDC